MVKVDLSKLEKKIKELEERIVSLEIQINFNVKEKDVNVAALVKEWQTGEEL